mmetsp:Transcript_19764/g.44055  ORF Transcript_19764/g.44055 Transcript_19764/m.44055 type:complete len:205 (-) Transcript_19764:3082-3696(-)
MISLFATRTPRDSNARLSSRWVMNPGFWKLSLSSARRRAAGRSERSLGFTATSICSRMRPTSAEKPPPPAERGGSSSSYAEGRRWLSPSSPYAEAEGRRRRLSLSSSSYAEEAEAETGRRRRPVSPPTRSRLSTAKTRRSIPSALKKEALFTVPPASTLMRLSIERASALVSVRPRRCTPCTSAATSRVPFRSLSNQANTSLPV